MSVFPLQDRYYCLSGQFADWILHFVCYFSPWIQSNVLFSLIALSPPTQCLVLDAASRQFFGSLPFGFACLTVPSKAESARTPSILLKLIKAFSLTLIWVLSSSGARPEFLLIFSRTKWHKAIPVQAKRLLAPTDMHWSKTHGRFWKSCP